MRPMSRVIGGILAVLIVAGLVTTTASGALILRLREPGMNLFAPNPDVMITPGQVITLEMWAIITDGGSGMPAGDGALASARAGAMSSEGGLILGETTLEPAGNKDMMGFSAAAVPANPELDPDGDLDVVDMNWAAMGMFTGGNPGIEHLIGVVEFVASADWLKDGRETYILPTVAQAGLSQWWENVPPIEFGTPTVEDEGPMSGVHLIPEPATLALVGLGLAALARRKRK